MNAAQRLGRVGTEQAEFRRAAQQAAHEFPVLALHALDVRHDLRVHELVGGLRDEPVFLAEALRREDALGSGLVDQPGAAVGDTRDLRHEQHLREDGESQEIVGSRQ